MSILTALAQLFAVITYHDDPLDDPDIDTDQQ